MKKAYTIQQKNSTAVNTLRSWFRAIGVQVGPGHYPAWDLTVPTPDGSTLYVAVVFDSTTPNDGVVCVNVKDVIHKNNEIAVNAFNLLTELAGYGKPNPLNRGKSLDLNAYGTPKNLRYTDDEFLVVLRHTEFRKSPNPPKDRWDIYKNDILACASRFYRMNQQLCQRHGIELDDLISLARGWIVNFCGRYETSTPLWFDNERKAWRYLAQRFSQYYRIIRKKERSIFPDFDTVHVALDNPPPELTLDINYLGRNRLLNTRSKMKRRKAAKELLDSLLANLPHDEMLNRLMHVIQVKEFNPWKDKEVIRENPSFDPSAIMEAKRYLTLHVSVCEICRANANLGQILNKEKDLAGGDLGGSME